MKSQLKYLLMLGMFTMFSCGTHGKFTHSRVMHNESAIKEIKTYFITRGNGNYSTCDIPDKNIKRKLNRLRVECSTVSAVDFVYGDYFHRDTVVELKTSGFWRYGETLLLVSQNDTIDKILESRYYEYYALGIYYNRDYFPMM